MEITFNPTLQPPWTLTDDKIISGGKVTELSSIARMKHNLHNSPEAIRGIM